MINNDKVSQQSGGVGAGSGVGKGSRLSREVSPGASAKVQLQDQADQISKVLRAGGEVGVTCSSDEPGKTKSSGEPRGGTWMQTTKSSVGQGDGREEGSYLFERITTPEKVRKLQLALYRKAKAEPKYRFYSLYGDLCRADVIESAMRAVAANGGRAGVDGEKVDAYTRSDEAWNAWRDKLINELKGKTYQPSPVRRVWIPKGDGKLRPLGIPTVKDRVAQGAMVLILMAIFEADFHPHSYAYRPNRNAHQAVTVIQQALWSGRLEVIDADLSGYFDSIPHDRLMKLVARRVSDGAVLGLIKAWLEAPIVEEDKESGRKRTLPNKQGTPQGGVISPLLANLYLDGLDKGVNERCNGVAVMVRYADDFVILCPKGRGAELMTRLKRWLEARGLKLNEQKTRLLDSRQGSFKFLGFEIAVRKNRRGQGTFPLVRPHPKSCQKLKEALRKELNHWTAHKPEVEVIQTVNRILKGWGNYFHFGNSTETFHKVQRYACERVRRWIWRKHGRSKALFADYGEKVLYEKYGLWKLPMKAAWKHAGAKG